MEAAEQLVRQDRIVCTYQLTRSVKLQLVRSPTERSKVTTARLITLHAVTGIVLALVAFSLVSATIPQHTVRFMAMTCSMAGWVFVAMAVVSRSAIKMSFYMLSAVAVFCAGIAGLYISISYLMAGMMLNVVLPLLPMMLSHDSRPLSPGLVTGWGIFYLVMTLNLVNFVLA